MNTAHLDQAVEQRVGVDQILAQARDCGRGGGRHRRGVIEGHRSKEAPAVTQLAYIGGVQLEMIPAAIGKEMLQGFTDGAKSDLVPGHLVLAEETRFQRL